MHRQLARSRAMLTTRNGMPAGRRKETWLISNSDAAPGQRTGLAGSLGGGYEPRPPGELSGAPL